MRRSEVLALLAMALQPPRGSAGVTALLEKLRDTVAEEELRRWLDAAVQRARSTRMEREYHRLFLGPTRPVAPPFESVYRDGVALGPSALRFLAELRSAGLEPAPGFRLPPDHVSLQLEYLAHLESHAERSREEGRPDEAADWAERARAFADEHLARWLPSFCARLEHEAPESPYAFLVRAAAKMVGVGFPTGGY
ncbi:MAG: molecular chaperone TorD family protein [Euryarchaeota archaeon]|nr:molecular chaperone TorD family protein [Euryarchaeota archaeon]